MTAAYTLSSTTSTVSVNVPAKCALFPFDTQRQKVQSTSLKSTWFHVSFTVDYNQSTQRAEVWLEVSDLEYIPCERWQARRAYITALVTLLHAAGLTRPQSFSTWTGPLDAQQLAHLLEQAATLHAQAHG